jgi:hypothetical protein
MVMSMAFTNDRALVRASPATPFPFLFFSIDAHQIYDKFGSDNTGEYSVLRLCILPSCGWANTTTLKLNMHEQSEYSPPVKMCIHYFQSAPIFIQSDEMNFRAMAAFWGGMELAT